MTQEEIKSTFLTIAERFGVPCVILAAVLWMFREAAVSVHETVVVPIVESHTEFLDRMATTQEKQADTLVEIAGGQAEIKKILITSGTE